MLANALKEKGVNVKYISSFDEIVSYLNKKASPDDLIITIGAGDVYKISSLLCQDA
jgi:UDP-N-acetylmuramate--alanine ligase